MAAVDVSDATFESDVIEKSNEVPVVVDLWAPWCGPCKTLGPIIEKVIDATDGKVVLAKVNVDENPAIGQAFKVQSIPAVYALKDGAVVDGFMGAYPEAAVRSSSTRCCRPRRRSRSPSCSPPATRAACGSRSRWSRRTRT